MACSTSFQPVCLAPGFFAAAAMSRRAEERIRIDLRMTRSLLSRVGIADHEKASAVGIAYVGIFAVRRHAVRPFRRRLRSQRSERTVRADGEDDQRCIARAGHVEMPAHG